MLEVLTQSNVLSFVKKKNFQVNGLWIGGEEIVHSCWTCF